MTWVKGLSMVFDLFPRITYLFLITLREKSGLSSDHGSGTDLKPWKGLYSAPSPIQKNYITKFLKVYYKVWCFVAHHPGPFSSINWVQMPFWRKLKCGLTKKISKWSRDFCRMMTLKKNGPKSMRLDCRFRKSMRISCAKCMSMLCLSLWC